MYIESVFIFRRLLVPCMAYYSLDWLSGIELSSAVWAGLTAPMAHHFSIQKFWVKVALKGNAVLWFACAKHAA